jgi:4-azaleucine resistance transporter AzlC
MFISAFKTSLPALLCYVPLGIVYGVLCAQSGYPWYYAPLFCTFVLAGAMQMIALSLLSAGASLFIVACAIIPLGIRNIFYGLTMLERFRPVHPLLKLYLAHGLVDATYSLLNTSEPPTDTRNDIRYMTWLTVLIHFYWVLGGLLGSFVIHFVKIPPGLEFALTAFFAAVAVEQLLKRKDFKAIWVSTGSLLLAFFAFPGHFFLGSIAIAALACLVLPVAERNAI